MTKGELRKLRKSGAVRDWNIERTQDGGAEIVRTRTARQERKHYERMERWARRNYETT
jgi:hypothetical protein